MKTKDNLDPVAEEAEQVHMDMVLFGSGFWVETEFGPMRLPPEDVFVPPSDSDAPDKKPE